MESSIDEDFINELLDSFEGEVKQEENMPNVNDLNKYLVASDVEDGDKLVFANAGKFVEKDFSKAKDGSDVQTVLEIDVKLPDGKIKLASPNSTSRRNLAEVFGPDTDEWVGKAAQVEVVKQNVMGNIRNVVYLTPAKIV